MRNTVIRHHMSNYLEAHIKMQEKEGDERSCEECKKKVSSFSGHGLFNDIEQ
jgi:hypothetical protein